MSEEENTVPEAEDELLTLARESIEGEYGEDYLEGSQESEELEDVVDEVSTSEDSDEASEETEAEVAEPESEEQDTPDVNSLVGKHNDEEYDIPEELKIPTKVDGKEVEVSLKDLRDSYSGKIAWDKKFQELSQDRESFSERVEKFNNNAKRFHDLANEGKAQEALDHLLDVAGLDRNHFINAYVSQLAPTIAEFMDMTPEERQAKQLEQEANYYKQQIESMKSSQETEANNIKLRNQVEETLQKYDLSAEEYESYQKELLELSRHGKISKDKLTPQFVGGYAQAVRQDELARKVLSQVDEALLKDRSAVDYLVSLQINNPGIVEKDLLAKAEKAFLAKAKEQVEARVRKNLSPSKLNRKNAVKSEAKNSVKTASTFDDLDINDLVDLL